MMRMVVHGPVKVLSRTMVFGTVKAESCLMIVVEPCTKMGTSRRVSCADKERGKGGLIVV